MPPRKKVVKKTVRKPKPKTPTATTSETPSLTPDTDTTPTPDTDTTPTPVEPETPLPIETTPETTTTATEPTETPSEPPETLETPEPETLAPEPETLTPEPETITPEPETLIPEPEIAPATETLATETAPSEAAPPAKQRKTVVKVRKVIKKKIVKKLVPKGTAAAKQAEKAAQEATAEEAEKAEQEEAVEDAVVGPVVGDEEEAYAERGSRRKKEIFVGGLDREAKEEDLREVFGKVGEIVEVRMIMDGQSGKNKGYAFVRYAEAAQAKKAVSEFEKVEVCGKVCGASALKGNDTIFLGNIDKKWKKDDVVKLLQEVGIENIEAVTIMADPNDADSNRGFAFLELESNKDAQIAYKKLQKKDAFGKGRNIKVSWAEPLNDPDEEDMKKVKSVYVEGVPTSWNEEKVRESFKKFGEIERIVLARNIKSAKRKDFAFVNYKTREAALLCIESFDKEEITVNGSKVNAKVSLAKPVQKGRQNTGGSSSSNKDREKPKAVQRNTKANVSSSKGYPFKGIHTTTGDKKSSTTSELLHVLREQATWKQGQVGYPGGPVMHDYAHGALGGKRHFSALGDETSYSNLRGYPRARLDSSFPAAGSSYGDLRSHGIPGSSMSYYQHQGAGYPTGALYGATDYTGAAQSRQGAQPPYGSSYYSRY